MEYNTARPLMVIPEYGRNIKKFIERIIEEPEKEKRTKMAYTIVSVMANLTTQTSDDVEFKHKLWDHLHIISDFKLDVNSPYPIPEKNLLQRKPELLNYPKKDVQFRHYGNNVKKIINKAIEFEEGDEKDTLVKMLANHMKKSYLSWNSESVEDEVIMSHLAMLSDNKLKLNESHKLNHTQDILARNKAKIKPKLPMNNGKPNNNNNRFKKKKNY